MYGAMISSLFHHLQSKTKQHTVMKICQNVEETGHTYLFINNIVYCKHTHDDYMFVNKKKF